MTEEKITFFFYFNIYLELAVNRSCPHKLDGFCYEPFYDDSTYLDAHNHCRSFGTGSNLVSILNFEEASRLKELIVNEFFEPYEDYWIGLMSNRYQWGDGSPLLYENFIFSYVPGTCVILSPNLSWIAESCTKRNLFLCEREIPTSGKRNRLTFPGEGRREIQPVSQPPPLPVGKICKKKSD